MIGYLFLFIAILAGVAKGYCGKKTSEYVNGITDGLILQILRLILCVLIGLCIFAFSKEQSQIDGIVLLIALLNGIANAIFLLSWIFSIKSGAYLFVDICLTTGGILIPCIGGHLFFKNTITPLQYIGIIIMLIAVLVMNGYNSSVTNNKTSFLNTILLVCVAISNGIMGFCEKLFAYYTSNNAIHCGLSVFTLLTFAFGTIVLLIALSLVCKRNKIKIKSCFQSFAFKKIGIYLILISAFLFFNTYLTTMTNTHINNTVLIYPLKFGSNLILSAVMASVVFKEKMNWRSVLGITLIISSILFINIL